jgi:hypothetical protein
VEFTGRWVDWRWKSLPNPRTTWKWGGGVQWQSGGEKEEEAREDWTEEARERKSLGREELMQDRREAERPPAVGRLRLGPEKGRGPAEC